MFFSFCLVVFHFPCVLVLKMIVIKVGKGNRYDLQVVPMFVKNSNNFGVESVGSLGYLERGE